MLFITLISEIFSSILVLLTVIADRIARVFKTPGASQVVVLDISKASQRVWHTALLYKFKLHDVMKMDFILLIRLVVVKDCILFFSTSQLLLWN